MSTQPSSWHIELRNILKTIYHPKYKWGDNQSRSYELMRHYVNTFRLKHLIANSPKDKFVIMDNMKGQNWFLEQSVSVRFILTGLIDQLKIIHEESLNTELTKLLSLVIDFGSFQLHTRYYQQVGDIVSLQIYLNAQSSTSLPSEAKSGEQRNYLAYYVKGNIITIPEHIKDKMDVPELTDINTLVGINDSMISSVLLLKFFLEIVLYYDETETVGLQKLSNTSTCDINESVDTLLNQVFKIKQEI